MHLYTSTLPLILACILLLLIMRIEISSKSPNGVLYSYMLNAEQMLVFPQTAQSEKSEADTRGGKGISEKPCQGNWDHLLFQLYASRRKDLSYCTSVE